MSDAALTPLRDDEAAHMLHDTNSTTLSSPTVVLGPLCTLLLQNKAMSPAPLHSGLAASSTPSKSRLLSSALKSPAASRRVVQWASSSCDCEGGGSVSSCMP